MGIHHFYNKKQHKDPLCDGKVAPEMLYYSFNGVMDPVFERVLTPSHFWDYLLRGHSGPWRNFLSSSHPRLQGFVIWFKASSACQFLQPFPSQGARRAASFSHIARFKKWGVNLRHGLLREAVGYTALTCWRLNNQLWDYLSSDSTVQKKRKIKSMFFSINTVVVFASPWLSSRPSPPRHYSLCLQNSNLLRWHSRWVRRPWIKIIVWLHLTQRACHRRWERSWWCSYSFLLCPNGDVWHWRIIIVSWCFEGHSKNQSVPPTRPPQNCSFDSMMSCKDFTFVPGLISELHALKVHRVGWNLMLFIALCIKKRNPRDLYKAKKYI